MQQILILLKLLITGNLSKKRIKKIQNNKITCSTQIQNIYKYIKSDKQLIKTIVKSHDSHQLWMAQEYF